MATRPPPSTTALEEIAAMAVIATADDRGSIVALEKLLTDLATAVPPGADREALTACARGLAAEGADVPGRLEAVWMLADRLRCAWAAAPRPPAPPVERSSASATPSAGPCEAAKEPPKPAKRDEETIQLFGDFLQEADEGVDKVDGLLLDIRNQKDSEGTVHDLFRVFHTIKGVSAFLEITDVTALAHTTETLLNKVREGHARLEGHVLDLVFDSTAQMRALLAGVRAAVEAELEVERVPSVRPLIQRLEAAVRGTVVPAAPPTPKVLLSAATVAPPVILVASAEAPPAGEPGLKSPSPRRSIGAPGASLRPKATSRALKAMSIRPMKQNEEPPTRPQRGPEGGGAADKLRPTLKIDVDRVDSVVEMIGEFIILESMVANAPEIAGSSSPRVRDTIGQLTKISRDLHNVAMRMRMVPVRGVFQKMARLVRDLSRKTGKPVVLEQSGEGAEMDRSMVERIEEPLVHMIRNSIDHGIEPVADRIARGKPETGTVRLSAYYEGGSIVIAVSDDGRGLDERTILAKAVSRGLVRDAERLTRDEILGFIFAPGFSTAAQVTEISGRGVGMDVVKRGIEAVRGRVAVSSEPGVGTTFRLVLPLTLAIIDGMLIACGDERYIVPSLSIVESLQPTAGMVRTLADRGEILNVRGEFLPLVRLHEIFAVPRSQTDPMHARVVIVESMGRKLGLLVDDVITQQHVVIKPLGAGLGPTDAFSGAAILSDGRVGLILNVDKLEVLVPGTRAFHANAHPTEGEMAS